MELTLEDWVYLASGESSMVFQEKKECEVQYVNVRGNKTRMEGET